MKKKKLTNLAAKVASGGTKAMTLVGDLNGDGKVDKADWEIARSRAKEFTDEIGDEATRLGKAVMRAEMTRDVATGAAIGAAVAIPVPIVGPTAGAVVGAGIGLYKNLTRPGKGAAAADLPAAGHNAIGDLAKLDDLRQRGVLTDEEFQAQKRKLLRRT